MQRVQLGLRRYATVRWNAWSATAFEQARRENKLVFVTSTSHSQWCDLMERETLADPRIVERLNAEFVPVRIQKDEQRGIDKSLMMFLQLKAQGQGGWPLNVVLSPTRFEPFVAASYLSADDLTKFLDAGMRVWRETPQLVDDVASEATNQLRDIRDRDHGRETQLDQQDTREQAALQYESLATESPRFVMGYALSVLDGELAGKVLNEMSGAGIVDHLWGGVYAYSVSSDWHFPSFQKTLSGQSTLLMACASHLRNTNDAKVVDLATGLVNYTAKLAPYTSESCTADLWTFDEFESALKSSDDGSGFTDLQSRDIAQSVWGVNDHGNINPELDPLNTSYGKNVLSLQADLGEIASAFGVDVTEVRCVLARSRVLLQQYHAKHKQPLNEVNQRIVLSDLGLALSGLSQISEFVPAARGLATELATDLRDPASAPSTTTDVESRTCDDYAFVVAGLLDFHQYIEPQNRSWVDAANAWQSEQIKLFEDSERGGFFYSQAVPNLYFRAKYTYDGADPNYNGVSARNLERLAQLGFSDYEPLVAKTRNIGVHGVLSSPLAHLSFLHSDA